MRAVRDQIDRTVASLYQPDARGTYEPARLPRLCRAMPDGRDIDRCQPGEAIHVRQDWKRHEMHDDAARKPYREQQTECDTQPAVKQNERAHDCGSVHHLAAAATS